MTEKFAHVRACIEDDDLQRFKNLPRDITEQAMRQLQLNPEVWYDADYGDCFWAYGHKTKEEMLKGARDFILEHCGLREWREMAESVRAGKAERLWGWCEDGKSPNEVEVFWISSEQAEPTPGAFIFAVTRLRPN